MAQELDSYRFTMRQGKRKYDWESWTNGSAWELHRGTREEVENGEADFAVDVKIFRQEVYTHASKNGLKIRTDILSEDVIVIQAYDPPVWRIG